MCECRQKKGSSEQSRSQKGESPHGITARLPGALRCPRARHPAAVLGGLRGRPGAVLRGRPGVGRGQAAGRPGAAGGAAEPGPLLSVPGSRSCVVGQSGSLARCRRVLSTRTWLKHGGSFTEGSCATSGFCCGTAVRAPHVARQLPPGSQEVSSAKRAQMQYNTCTHFHGQHFEALLRFPWALQYSWMLSLQGRMQELLVPI